MIITRLPGEQVRVPINASASGDNTIISGQAGKRIVVHQFAFSCQAPVAISFEDSDGVIHAGPWSFDSTGGAAPPLNPVGMFELATGKDLVMNLSSAVQVGGFVHAAFI